MNASSDDPSRQAVVQAVYDNLTRVEDALQKVMEEHRHGTYGYLTREWGFTAPGGLGGAFAPDSKFEPWQDKLRRCRLFFWPQEAYGCMEQQRDAVQADTRVLRMYRLKQPYGEQLYRNAPLHEFLLDPPTPAVELFPEDCRDYRTAAKLFLLLGTLSHLYGNSAPDPMTAGLPEWIEQPLVQIAARLQVEPTLSAHFLQQENWIWKGSTNSHHHDNSSSNHTNNHRILPHWKNESSSEGNQVTAAQEQIHPQHPLRRQEHWRPQQQHRDKMALRTLLQYCDIADRRYRVKLYPSCFVASQAVDVLVDHELARTREDAVRTARRLNQQYHLFHHVCDNHLFMDKYLFFRFLPKWQHCIERNTISQALDEWLDGSEAAPHEQVELTTTGGNADVPTSRLLRPKDLFVRKGTKDSSDSPIQRKNTKDSNASSAASNNKRTKVNVDVARVNSNASNTSANTAGKRRIRNILAYRTSSSGSDHGQDGTSNQPQPQLASASARLTTSKLALHDKLEEDGIKNMKNDEALNTIAVMGMIKVKDRKYHFRTYKQCWIGSQMIDLLVEQECAPTRKDALQLALNINQRFQLFDHVCGHHHIKDEYLFYRFRPKFETVMMLQRPTEVHRHTENNCHPHDDDDKDDASQALTAEEDTSRSRRSMDSVRRNTQLMLDENMHSSFIGISTRMNDGDENDGDENDADDGSLGSRQEQDNNLYEKGGFMLEDDDHLDEFRIDYIEMLYPAFGHAHEKMNQLIPACMGHALSGLPFYILDIISTMRNILEAEISVNDISSVDSYESRRLYDLLYKVAFSLSRCREEFQQMSTDPMKRTFNSKHISIRQTQPLSNGVVVQGQRRKGTTGTQFPYFHLLDWLLGRYQFKGGSAGGLVAQIAAIDETYPRPQREFIAALSKLNKSSTLRGFLDLLGQPRDLLTAYNHVIECYAGEGGVLQAHGRKLYSYIHNDVQFSTSGTTHLDASGDNRKGGGGGGGGGACPMSKAANNHMFATTMFKHMQQAVNDRWVLRMPPLMNEVSKMVYSTSESGGFTTVALDLLDSGLQYEYGDVVKVLVPNSDKRTYSWIMSLMANNQQLFTQQDMESYYKNTGNGWGWAELWEALGWSLLEEKEGGVPLEIICRFIEQGRVRDTSGKTRWVNSPLDMNVTKTQKLFPVPPPLSFDNIASLEPVSPRVYSVSGVEVDRVFLLVSKPQDGARHHGYDGMCDPQIDKVYCSFTPATFFLVPPRDVNLVCIASGTGISPFVGLADAIGARRGSYTIAHQCKSSDLFLANSQSWLDFTASNPGAVVLGFISGDNSRRNCPMRYVIRNGSFEETTVLRRHNASAYYFECGLFQSRIQETYREGGLNLAYCCGGVQSAIEPLREIARKEGLTFEFTCECYGVPPTLTKDEAACQIGGTVLSLDHVSPIHPGGDQILHQIHQVALETQQAKTPDHSIAFWELHPHAYNLWRCLRTPVDADSEAFAAFLERQAARKSVMVNMAAKYAEVALASPDDSKILRIATELQANAVRRQLALGETQNAKEAAGYLEALLRHVSPQDQDADRWRASLSVYHDAFKPAENGDGDPASLLASHRESSIQRTVSGGSVDC